MEAKNTVSPKDYKKMMEEFKNHPDEGNTIKQDFNAGKQAGIREVVEDVVNAMETAKIGYFAATVERCLEKWQAKLKEWGV